MKMHMNNGYLQMRNAMSGVSDWAPAFEFALHERLHHGR